MGTLTDKLAYAEETKTAIKNAIIAKNVNVNDSDTFRSYADKLDEINEINPEWTSWQYFSYKNNRNDLVQKLKYSDTSNSTNFGHMFDGCSSLATIPTIDTSKGTNFNAMFYDCTALTTVPELNTGNGTSFNHMFYGCNSLTTISALDMSKGTNFEYTFARCTALKNLTMTGAIKASGMDLKACTALSKSSITSVINSLSSDVTGKNITLSQTAVNKAFETSEGEADGSTSAEWLSLIATKSNWTIVLS